MNEIVDWALWSLMLFGIVGFAVIAWFGRHNTTATWCRLPVPYEQSARYRDYRHIEREPTVYRVSGAIDTREVIEGIKVMSPGGTRYCATEIVKDQWEITVTYS